jgi:hypothetical protein
MLCVDRPDSPNKPTQKAVELAAATCSTLLWALGTPLEHQSQHWSTSRCMMYLRWRNAQVRQYDVLLAAPPALAAAPNINALAARLAVEELCRLGASTFAIAPGAASPLQHLRPKGLRHCSGLVLLTRFMLLTVVNACAHSLLKGLRGYTLG